MNLSRIKSSILCCIVFLLTSINVYSQVISTNRNPVGMENNLLFNSTKRYNVTQNGAGLVELNSLFDGRFGPSYSSIGISTINPTVITIENLPSYHTQAGAWVGWSTRYWPARRFKIEGYQIYNDNAWVTIADYSNKDYENFDFYTPLYGIFTKLRFTFYEGTGDGGRFGLSELLFIHPEAVSPYEGLLNAFNSISEVNSNVLIGKTSQLNPTYKLDVAGKIRADEITVNTNGADFVFGKDYNLRPLNEVENFVKINKHLPDIAPASEMQTNGISMGDMNAKLLQKIEELTLYLIMQNKLNEQQSEEIKSLKKLLTKITRKK